MLKSILISPSQRTEKLSLGKSSGTKYGELCPYSLKDGAPVPRSKVQFDLSSLSPSNSSCQTSFQSPSLGISFVEHEHRIDCVKRVAEALGINYDQFLSGAEYFLPDTDISGLKKNEAKSDKEDLSNEFNELKQEIARFRINE